MRRTSTVAALLAILLVLLWSIGRLFALRFERGDVYPPYSTLRADPLGAKALADSLALMPGREVRRNYQPLVRLKPKEPVVLAYVAVDYRVRWEEAELAEFERIISTGSRAVIAFDREVYRTAPQRLGGATPTPGASPIPGAAPPPGPSPGKSKEELPGIAFGEVAKDWHFAFDIAQEVERRAMQGTAEPTAPSGLHENIPWHSALYFKSLGAEWKTLYACNNLPVVVERAFGDGSIVLCSDAYFLSNEGLTNSPAAEFLSHLFASRETIVFDEEHLGVSESSNIATLARRMRLDGVVLALAVVASLYVWKQSTSLLPPRNDTPADHDVTGSDASEGFIKLLHRSVAPGALLESCVAAWARTRGRVVPDEERAHIETVLRAHRGRRAKDAPAAYRSIAEGLKRR